MRMWFDYSCADWTGSQASQLIHESALERFKQLFSKFSRIYRNRKLITLHSTHFEHTFFITLIELQTEMICQNGIQIEIMKTNLNLLIRHRKLAQQNLLHL